TTSATLYALPGGGAAIDTPGIRSFLLHEPDLASLHSFFPEIATAGAACRFANCRHSGDAGCALPAAVERGDVDEGRLESYRVLRDEVGG
ncbi:MAG: ribosome small subunit-dependent GTPase A, partial [Gemmatimonadetes bacterium]|nr:ribosome small subunit-dependent GTPase A [Gemmatimonadota bacterium]